MTKPHEARSGGGAGRDAGLASEEQKGESLRFSVGVCRYTIGSGTDYSPRGFYSFTCVGFGFVDRCGVTARINFVEPQKAFVVIILWSLSWLETKGMLGWGLDRDSSSSISDNGCRLAGLRDSN